MQVITGNLLDVQSGIIAHQVNCRGAFGAGVARQIAKRYPRAKADYLAFVQRTGTGSSLLGQVVYTPVSSDVRIAHLFAQDRYGNPAKTGEVYTDLNALVRCLTRVCAENPDTPVYVPYGIGAGFGGETWERVENAIGHLPVTAVRLP